MANTYTQLINHIVFSTKGRQKLIRNEWQEPLNKFITGLVQNKGQKMLAINGVQDHIHILVGMTPDLHVSELVREIKKSSTAFMNDKFTPTAKFQWQIGFGAFTIRRSDIAVVGRYIARQQEHHKIDTFEDEYRNLLIEHEVNYNEKYIFD